MKQDTYSTISTSRGVYTGLSVRWMDEPPFAFSNRPINTPEHRDDE